MTRARWIALGGTALLALGVWWFLRHFERDTVEVPTGYLGEARTNRYYAASRLFAEMGLEVRTFSQVSALREPPPGGVLVVPGQRSTLSDEVQRGLWSWVEAGGHLIVVVWTLFDPERPDAIDDPLLHPLGLRQYMDEQVGSEQCPGDGEDTGEGAGEGEAWQGEGHGVAEDGGESPLCIPVLPPAELEMDGRTLQVAFDSRFDMTDAHGRPADWRVSSAYGTHLLSYPLGEGRLTVLTDLEFMENLWIDRHDHAEFGVRLVSLHGDGPVWVFHDERHPSLLRLLLDHAWAPLIALGLWIVLALWRGGARLGPPLPAPGSARRELREHLDASGRHAWRWSRGRDLLEGLRRGIEREAARRSPGWLRMDRDARIDQLASHAGVEAEAARSAMEDAPDHAAGFVETVSTLEKLRSAR